MPDYSLFDRRYELLVSDGVEEKSWQGGEKDGVWQGFELSFKITKTGDAVPNECDLEIKNLNPDTRAWISQRNLRCVLKAGYRDGFGQIFVGNIELVSHEHQGNDWVSKVFCKDAGAALRDLTVFETFKKDTPIATVIGRILKKLTGIPDGIEAQFQKINQIAQGQIDLTSFKPKKAKPKHRKRTKKQPDPVSKQQEDYLNKKRNTREKAEASKLKRAETLRGAAVDKLQLLCDRVGLTLVISDLTVNIYPRGLALASERIVLDQDSGLIGSPEKTEKGYKIKSFLRHQFNVGLLVEVASLYASGAFVIKRIEINGAIPGEWTSDLECEEFEE